MIKTFCAAATVLMMLSFAPSAIAQPCGDYPETINPDGSVSCGYQTVPGPDVEVYDDPDLLLTYDADTGQVSTTERQIAADGGYAPPPGRAGNGVYEPGYYGYLKGSVQSWSAAQWVLNGGGTAATVYGGINSIPPRNALIKSLSGKAGLLGVAAGQIAEAGVSGYSRLEAMERADCLRAQEIARGTPSPSDDIMSC